MNAADPGYDRVAGRAQASRSEVIAPHAMAATSQPLATQIALDILKAGGSAVDAAIAANAALGLMEPTGNGIGGDLFAIVWDAEKQQLSGLNASGRAPQAMTVEGKDAPAAVPGAAVGPAAQQQHGPAVRALRDLHVGAHEQRPQEVEVLLDRQGPGVL